MRAISHLLTIYNDDDDHDDDVDDYDGGGPDFDDTG